MRTVHGDEKGVPISSTDSKGEPKDGAAESRSEGREGTWQSTGAAFPGFESSGFGQSSSSEAHHEPPGNFGTGRDRGQNPPSPGVFWCRIGDISCPRTIGKEPFQFEMARDLHERECGWDPDAWLRIGDVSGDFPPFTMPPALPGSPAPQQATEASSTPNPFPSASGASINPPSSSGSEDLGQRMQHVTEAEQRLIEERRQFEEEKREFEEQRRRSQL